MDPIELTENHTYESQPLLPDDENDRDYEFDRELTSLPVARWKDLFWFCSPSHLPLFLVGIFLSTISGIIIPLQSVLYGLIFQEFASYGQGTIDGRRLRSKAGQSCQYLVYLGIANWVLQALVSMAWSAIGEHTAKRARNTLFLNLLRKETAWYDLHAHGIGALLPRLQTEIKDLQKAISNPLRDIIQCLATAVACLGVAFWCSWKLALVTLGTLPIIAYVFETLSRKAQTKNHEHAAKSTEAMKHVSVALKSIKTIKCFNGESTEVRNFSEAVTAAGTLYSQMARLTASQHGFMRAALLAVFVQGFLYGNILVAEGKSSPGLIMTTFWASLMATQNLASVMPQLAELEKGKLVAIRLQSILKQGKEEQVTAFSKDNDAENPFQGDIELRAVSFRYPAQTDRPALVGASLTFRGGETTFVVGKSGSGKSTIGQLLMRFYDPSEGVVFINGERLDSIDIRSIRSSTTLLEQSSVLFDDTIGHNISIGRPTGESVQPAHIQQAAEFALLEEFIREIPDGYDTHVSDIGESLSGGQKQRVALARVKLRDTPILILDEFSSALDPGARTCLLTSIRKWRRGKTTIIITHDLSQIQQEDFVYILESGRVSHEGLFKHIRSQLGIADTRSRSDSVLQPEDAIQSYHQNMWETATSEVEKGTPNQVADISARTPRGRHDVQQKLPWQGKATRSHGSFSVLRILRTVWPNLDPRTRVLLAVAIFSAAVQAAANPVFSFVFSVLLSAFFAPGNASHIAFQSSMAILVIAIIDGIATFVFSYLIEYCAETWSANVRVSVFRKVLLQPCEFFDTEENIVSHTTECLDNHAVEMREIFSWYTGSMFLAIVMMIIALFWSMGICWELTLLVFIPLPLAYAITALYNTVSESWVSKCNVAEEKIGEMATEALTNIHTVRCFTLEDTFSVKYTAATLTRFKLGLDHSVYTGVIFGVMQSTTIFMSAWCFWCGAYLASHGKCTTKDVVACFAILLMTMTYASSLLSDLPRLSSARDYSTKLLQLTRLPTHSHEQAGLARVSTISDIVLRNVTFEYPSRPSVPVLQDFSLRINKGTSIALVGPSGCGKSTIASLLLALYAPSSNSFNPSTGPSITVNNLDLVSIHTPTLRSLIALVPQSPLLFPTTIARNIAYALEHSDPRASLRSITAAAQAAGIHDFISSLEEGYNTRIGPGGMGLSGGQTQRLAIARALVRRPDVLILDEATAALDHGSAEVVRGCAGRWVQEGMTMVVVTHDEEMMKVVREVVLIEEGRVVEKGAYADLMACSGRFRRFLAGERGDI